MTSKTHTELVAAVRAGIDGDTGYTKPEVFKDAYAALESLEEQLEASQKALVEHHRVGYAPEWGERCPICEKLLASYPACNHRGPGGVGLILDHSTGRMVCRCCGDQFEARSSGLCEPCEGHYQESRP